MDWIDSDPQLMITCQPPVPNATRHWFDRTSPSFYEDVINDASIVMTEDGHGEEQCAVGIRGIGPFVGVGPLSESVSAAPFKQRSLSWQQQMLATKRRPHDGRHRERSTLRKNPRCSFNESSVPVESHSGGGLALVDQNCALAKPKETVPFLIEDKLSGRRLVSLIERGLDCRPLDDRGHVFAVGVEKRPPRNRFGYEGDRRAAVVDSHPTGLLNRSSRSLRGRFRRHRLLPQDSHLKEGHTSEGQGPYADEQVRYERCYIHKVTR